MIDHTGIGVADVARSAAFYDAALGALGLRRVMRLPENDGSDGVGYGVDYPIFWIDRFHPHGVKQHTAFAARSRAEVDAFHAAALNAGGIDNGAPGLRGTTEGYPPPAITPRSCWIPTETTWRPYSANPDRSHSVNAWRRIAATAYRDFAHDERYQAIGDCDRLTRNRIGGRRAMRSNGPPLCSASTVARWIQPPASSPSEQRVCS